MYQTYQMNKKIIFDRRKLEYSSKIKPIMLRGKQLVRSGSVVQLLSKTDTEYKLTFGKKFNKTPLYLLLFTDYLLVTKLKSRYHTISFNKLCIYLFIYSFIG